MDSKSRKKHQTYGRHPPRKHSARAPAPTQPVPDERQNDLRENFETDVAPDLIEAERSPTDLKRREPICNLPPEKN